MIIKGLLGGRRRSKTIKTGSHQIQNKIMLTLVPNVGFATFELFFCSPVILFQL